MKTLILNIDTAGPDALAEAARLVRDGALAVFPTDTVYGLGANALRAESVARIYALKNRPPGKPLPVFAGSVVTARKIAQFTAPAEKLAARFWPGRLTLILPPAPGWAAFARGAAGIGVRVPGHSRLRGWLATIGEPLAQTSANSSGSPALTDEAGVLARFDGAVDIILTGGQLNGTESTVADLTGLAPVLLRQGAVTAEDFLAAL
ncbi:MAG: L-threonylcarbamoyladenylate synthase [Elusimicrobiaceae bacterium]|nr:L-threonylcarbamoyladenylate synthase [Elusimicrobiaceae bacterium]